MKDLKDFLDRPHLTHLKRLTTKDGVIQHADHEVPDPGFGYSIDDNARAAIVCLWHYELFGDQSVLGLFNIYRGYLKKARNEFGSFHNFLSFTEQILDNEGSEDSVARTIWAMGEIVKRCPEEEAKKEHTEMIELTKLEKYLVEKHIRTKAYIALGLITAGKKEGAVQWLSDLVVAYKENSSDDWKWFEDSLRYANGILPYTMIRAYRAFKEEKYKEIAIESFDWLDKNSRKNGIPCPIGQNGWYEKGGEKAEYDQQPLEAADMVMAAACIYENTGDKKYLEKAIDWMNWYYGNNIKKIDVFNQNTIGVHDAITPDGVNLNQGAESIITYLLAYLTLHKIAKKELA